MSKSLHSLVITLALAGCLPPQAKSQFQAHTLPYAPGKSITLTLPAGLDIHVAASGLKRPRFFAQSPDGRLFVTTMFNLADNTNGTVTILDGWNPATHTFARTIPYLQHLHNPNNLAFYTDDAHQTWLYLPLTDKLVRYKYSPGDNAPTGPAQILMRFPDYGLNYKYGGWHLTRTVAIATLHGRTRAYVTVGSSCNYCRELEAQRASLIVMNPDGSEPQILAHGLRNGVDLRFVPNLDGGALFTTNMGDDHLGDKLPEDTFFELDSNDKPGPIFLVHQTAKPAPAVDPRAVNGLTVPPVNYGWPTCYFANGHPTLDTTPLPTDPGPNNPKDDAPRPTTSNGSAYGKQSSGAAAGTNLAARIIDSKDLPALGSVPSPLTTCKQVPAAYNTFAAHSSPLGLAYFGADNATLKNTFVVALHGSGHPHIGTGYRLVTFTPTSRNPQDFLTGFLTRDATGKPVIHGRPCGLLRLAQDTFLVTDDFLGLVYVISPAISPAH